jgi:shikimate dehydrogenase
MTTPMATDRYAVIGSGIGYSRSPRIHALFAAATGQALDYGLLDVGEGEFEPAVRRFFAAGGRGLNVTVPYKERALALATQLTPRARSAGAVNTLAPQGEALLGDNTDGAGLVRDLAVNLSFHLADARVLLLGAGGAARGITGPLAAAGVRTIDIANRDPDRAAQLCQAQAALGVLRAAAGDAAGPYALVVNATAAGRAGAVPQVPAGAIGPGTLCYDLSYGAAAAPFLEWARAAGAGRVVDGLGMLVEQAAESFLLWRGVRPETAPVLASLRAG